MVSHNLIDPSPPALSRVRPSRFQSTSNTGKPFLCPSSTIEVSFTSSSSEQDMIEKIRTAASSQPAAIRRPSGGQSLAQDIPIPDSSQMLAASSTIALLEVLEERVQGATPADDDAHKVEIRIEGF
mmetsp:Transcript_8438/g.13193  ORF Transcript_8438/g.13193 Transcript_8438/m.13193 type:complete len:126 (-) Transcript_8438:1831-2208(-)